MAERIKYTLESENSVTANVEVTSLLSDYRMPNQIWKGYYDIEKFNSQSWTPPLSPKPSKLEFFDFGKSVYLYGCAVCSMIGAVNVLNNTQLTIYEAYKQGGFSWDRSKKDKYGRYNAPTLARWSWTKKYGVLLNSGSIHYDYDRSYPWCTSNKKFVNTSITPTEVSQSSEFYIPTENDGTGLYRATYNQGGGAWTKGSTEYLAMQTYFRAYQVKGIKRIIDDLSNGKKDLIYICSSKNGSGHFVLAVAYNSNGYTGHSHSGLAVDQIQVIDPCFTNGYYAKITTLDQSMKRMNADISDGIRTIQTASKIS